MGHPGIGGGCSYDRVLRDVLTNAPLASDYWPLLTVAIPVPDRSGMPKKDALKPLTGKQMTQKESLFKEDTYNALIRAANDIKAATRLDGSTFQHQKNQINASINRLETAYGFRPSFRNFINKLITEHNLTEAKNRVIQRINTTAMYGFSPDIKILIEEVITEANILAVENDFIDKLKLINE